MGQQQQSGRREWARDRLPCLARARSCLSRLPTHEVVFEVVVVVVESVVDQGDVDSLSRDTCVPSFGEVHRVVWDERVDDVPLLMQQGVVDLEGGLMLKGEAGREQLISTMSILSDDPTRPSALLGDSERRDGGLGEFRAVVSSLAGGWSCTHEVVDLCEILCLLFLPSDDPPLHLLGSDGFLPAPLAPLLGCHLLESSHRASEAVPRARESSLGLLALPVSPHRAVPLAEMVQLLPDEVVAIEFAYPLDKLSS